MEKSTGKAKKILIAEDETFIARAYRDGLTRAGFEISLAPDGEQAMKQVKHQKPDLILLDLIMPVKDGFEFLKEIKEDQELKNIPVVILSNLGQGTDIQKGKELGAMDYLIKSNLSMKEVIQKVRGYLGLGES